MSDTPLSEFLGEQPEAEQIEAAPAEGQPRDEHGRFATKTGEEPQPQEAVAESVTPTPEPQEERIPIAALKDERSKRQQLEERLRQYDEYFAQLQAHQQPQQRIEKPDMFADPEGYEAHLRSEILAQVKQELQPTIQQGQIMGRAEVSEMLARQKYEDYDAKIEVFKEALQSNPFLLTQIQQAADPATFAYNAALKYEEAKQYGTASPTREQIEAELREKLIAELGINRPKAPSTFASDRSVGSRSGPEWSGPTPLGQMLA